ncbi:hypothetical protein [Rathayibacter sp. AY1D9]|uniref:hypothetical protein n=1 Tax=Rathayibacter sp. AY1D9 TaxID=2080548 RepID=UPI0011B0CB6D|nr:hypothetical protein [Rathayibacter sp. AY1D9]
MADQRHEERVRVSRVVGGVAIVLVAVLALLVQAGAGTLTLGSPAMTECRPSEIPLGGVLWYAGALLALGGAVLAAAKTTESGGSAQGYALLLTAILGVISFTGLAILIAGLMGIGQMDDPGPPPSGGPVLLLIAAFTTPSWALGASSVLLLSKRARARSTPTSPLIAFAAIITVSIGAQVIRFALTC